MTHTWEECADEFGRLTKQGKDVRLALLVACSVEKGRGGPRTVPIGTVSKVSARDFAERAGTSQARVLRHLKAWDKFAESVGLPSAEMLEPDDAYTLTITEKQAAEFENIRITEPPVTPTPPPAPSAPVRTIAEQRGPQTYGTRMTRAEEETLGAACEDLYVNGGYSLNEICRAAGVKNNSTIRRLLLKRGIATRRGQARGEDPQPIQWSHRPVPATTPAPAQPEAEQGDSLHSAFTDYRVDDWRRLRSAAEKGEDLKIFAFAVADAQAAGASEWLAAVKADLVWINAMSETLIRLFDEPAFIAQVKADPSLRYGWEEVKQLSERQMKRRSVN